MIEAEPDAVQLLVKTSNWGSSLEKLRKHYSGVAIDEMRVATRRFKGNEVLDNASTSFGLDLFNACGGDRTTKRFTQYYSTAVSTFNRLALETQTPIMRGWLSTKDEVLEKHRTNLTRGVELCEEVLAAENRIPLVYNEAQRLREVYCKEFTNERDGLHDELSAVGRSKGYERDWADRFFRKSPATSKKKKSMPGSSGVSTA